MDKDLRKEIGKFFVDVAKLLIGGAVLSSVLKIQGISSTVVMIVGTAVAIIFAILGFSIMSMKDKK
ncbi:MAG: DUF6722 family protein [Chitinophagales bacterium]